MAPPESLDPAVVVAVLSSMYVSPTILPQNLNTDTLAVAPPTISASRRWVICPTTLRDGRSLTCNAAFLVFDHLLTFAQEVDLFWKPKLTGAAVIFLLNQYIVLGTMIFNVSGIFFTVPPKVRRRL